VTDQLPVVSCLLRSAGGAASGGGHGRSHLDTAIGALASGTAPSHEPEPVHPEVVGRGARRLRRLNLSTPLPYRSRLKPAEARCTKHEPPANRIVEL